jgi:4-oxalocrotonate tautomerase
MICDTPGPRATSSPALQSIFPEVEFMPLIQVKVIEGVFSDAQKREIVQKLTDAMVSIEGENMRPVTWVMVEDVKSGEWAIGGNPLTTADVKNLAEGKKAA